MMNLTLFANLGHACNRTHYCFRSTSCRPLHLPHQCKVAIQNAKIKQKFDQFLPVVAQKESSVSMSKRYMRSGIFAGMLFY